MTVINRLLFAFGQCKETDNVILIFAQVKDRNFAPDLYTYNTVFEILGRAGRTGEMLGLFGEMKEAGIDPDLVSYNTVINHVRKFGEVEMCLFYFKEMCEKGVQPDLLTYTAVIDGLGRSGNIEESLRFFDEMMERRIQPSLYLYRAVISNLKKIGKVEMAVTFMEEMSSCASSLASPRWSKRVLKAKTHPSSLSHSSVAKTRLLAYAQTNGTVIRFSIKSKLSHACIVIGNKAQISNRPDPCSENTGSPEILLLEASGH